MQPLPINDKGIPCWTGTKQKNPAAIPALRRIAKASSCLFARHRKDDACRQLTLKFGIALMPGSVQMDRRDRLAIRQNHRNSEQWKLQIALVSDLLNVQHRNISKDAHAVDIIDILPNKRLDRRFHQYNSVFLFGTSRQYFSPFTIRLAYGFRQRPSGCFLDDVNQRPCQTMAVIWTQQSNQCLGFLISDRPLNHR